MKSGFGQSLKNDKGARPKIIIPIVKLNIPLDEFIANGYSVPIDKEPTQ